MARRVTSPYCSTRDPPLNGVGVDVGGVGAVGVVEEVVGHVEAEMHGHGGHERQHEPQRVEGVVAGRNDPAEADGDERGGQEGQAGGEEDGPQPAQPGPRPQLVEVVAPGRHAALGVLEERGVGLVPAARPPHGDTAARSPVGVAGPHRFT